MVGVKKIAMIAIALVGAVLVLALTCPDEESFGRWANKTLVNESGSVVEKVTGKASAAQAKWTADYESYVLWATVEAYQGGSERRYLGVLGMWLSLGEV